MKVKENIYYYKKKNTKRISMNLEMLSTLESLANKLSSVQQNKGILVDNNGNKLHGLSAVIKSAEKAHQQHKESFYSKPTSNNSIKYTEK